MTNVTDLIRQHQEIACALSPQDECLEESRDMVNLAFTGRASEDPEIRVTSTGNTIAMFPVSVKEQPHLPPTTIVVVAFGKQAVYAQYAVKKNSLVMVSGWFYVEQNKKGNEFVVVKARHLRALIV